MVPNLYVTTRRVVGAATQARCQTFMSASGQVGSLNHNAILAPGQARSGSLRSIWDRANWGIFDRIPKDPRMLLPEKTPSQVKLEAVADGGVDVSARIEDPPSRAQPSVRDAEDAV